MANDTTEPETEPETDPIPEAVQTAAERLTRLAQTVVDETETASYRERRDSLVAEYGYTGRFREDDETLVLYPESWVDNGTVRFDKIDDTSRAVEIPLSATADEAEFEAIETHNAELVAAVEDAHGPVHAANVRAFADFMGNHYLMRIEEASARHLTEFYEEYYLRNAWPSKKQQAVVETSLEYAFDAADSECPTVPE